MNTRAQAEKTFTFLAKSIVLQNILIVNFTFLCKNITIKAIPLHILSKEMTCKGQCKGQELDFRAKCLVI